MEKKLTVNGKTFRILSLLGSGKGGFSYLAENDGLNIDYFPTSFIAQRGVLYYIGYECSEYMQEWSFESWGIRFWPCTPEFEACLAGRKEKQ